MYLLRQVAAGRVVRGEDGQATAIAAGHYLDGELVRLELQALARDDLILMPISGPPTMAPRGAHLLRVANGEVAADR